MTSETLFAIKRFSFTKYSSTKGATLPPCTGHFAGMNIPSEGSLVQERKQAPHHMSYICHMRNATCPNIWIAITTCQSSNV